jgi:dTMP kinase
MKGKLIVIEGVDSSGKHTQAKLLLKRLKKEGKKAVLVSFPRYSTFFGKLVKKYLKGDFGALKKVRPELASLLYSLDRFDAMPWLEEQLSSGKIVVCDRYTASNIAHQASKFKGKKRKEFISWVQGVESRLPKPDATIFLDLPVSVSAKLMSKRKRKKDIHELDLPYLRETRKVYLSLSKRPAWSKIECQKGLGIKSREEIHKLLWKKAKKCL